MAAEDGGFLSRWSRRKAQERAGAPPVAATGVPPTAAPALVQATVPDGGPRPVTPQPPVADPGDSTDPTPHPEAQAQWTLEDVRVLTGESDFSPFVSGQVPSEVRNAAMKKLFSDPAFNVMDGLDIYIDDYSRPDPLPAGLARQLVSAQIMKLFDAPPEAGGRPSEDKPPVAPGSHADLAEAGPRTPAPEAGLEPGPPEETAPTPKLTEP